MDVHRFRSFRPSVEMVIGAVVVLVTVFHGLSYLLSSYTASTSAVKAWWMILGYQAALIVILAGSAYFNYLRAGKNIEMPARCLTSAMESYGKFLPSLVILSCVGLALHAYSKLALVNFHPPGCIGELRNVWITTPHEQIPFFQRTTSVLGHLLSSFTYAGLFFSIYRFSIDVRKTMSFVFACVFFLIGVAYAAFIGSQNVVLAHLVVAVLAVGLGAISVPEFWRGWSKRLLIFFCFATFTAFFSMSVFNNRVQCGGAVASMETYKQYEEGFLDEIPMIKKPTITEVSQEVRQLCEACNAIFIYLNHGIYNFQHIVTQEDVRGDPVFFNFFRGLAKRLGYPLEEKAHKVRVYGLGGATLPGSAYHDFGFIGLVLLGIVHALLAISAGHLLRSGAIKWEGVGLVLYVVVGFITGLSMMFVGFNVIAFPFVVWSTAMAATALIIWVKIHDMRVRKLSDIGSTAAPSSVLNVYVPAQNVLLGDEIVAEK